MTLAAVLVDVDGTLLDSNDAHAQAWSDALKQHRIDVSADVLRPFIGKGGDKVLPEVAGIAADSAKGRLISAARAKSFREKYLTRLNPTNGARMLLERFARDGLALVVVTSADQADLTALLRQADVDDLFDLHVTSDDASSSKPEPDVVEAALRRAQVSPAQVFMLGDTPFDIEAAQAAGVVSVALRCGGCWGDESLQGAAAIYNDPADLLAGLDSLSLYRV